MEIKAKVIEVLGDDEIRIDRKIRGCDIIKISNIDELLNDIREVKGKRIKSPPVKSRVL